MTAEIRLMDDDGNPVGFYVGDAFIPWSWKTNPETPIRIPVFREGKQVGEYLLFGFTYQPMVKLLSRDTY